MKILVIAIVTVVSITIIASISLLIIPDNRQHCTFCPEIPSPNQTLQITNGITGNVIDEQQKTSTSENQTKVGMTQTIPSCVSNISHQYANAGPMGLPLCPFAWYSASGKILNATGFYGIYNYTDYPNVQNYVLEPGHNGTLTYSILLSSINTDARIPEYPDGVNISNDVEFMHDANMQNHPGIDVSVYPQVEIIREHTNALTNITISASQNASHGTYWIHLPLGICMGGQIIVLTITNCEK